MVCSGVEALLVFYLMDQLKVLKNQMKDAFECLKIVRDIFNRMYTSAMESDEKENENE